MAARYPQVVPPIRQAPPARPSQQLARVGVKQELGRGVTGGPGATPPGRALPVGPPPSSGKRPADAAAADSSSKRPAGAAPSRLRVYTNSQEDEIGIQTLVGEYAESGANHGRPVYQKVQSIPGHEDVQVYMYYWDTRDGADFCGWWFGDQVGGSQVWSRAAAHGQAPPAAGWRVPWDGD
ncbi:unnamed protein product, partial [Polarella glacialis]